MTYTIKRLWIDQSQLSRDEWELFLKQAKIRPENTVDYTVGLYDQGKIIATGSIYHNVLKCLAVCKGYQGGAVLNRLVSHLMNEVFDRGYNSCYVYTKPESVQSFLHLGFTEIARVTDQLAFLEKATVTIKSFINELKKQKQSGRHIAGIVMNANPFTLGHQYLIEKASIENDVVHIFVLSEDLSVFPAKVRKNLVKKGIAHLDNVYVHSTGNYLVSAKTFPSYFLEEDTSVTEIQASLDAIIFRDHIAPALGINRRYVGNEPDSIATHIYNQALKKTFGKQIELVIEKRKEIASKPISASRVRHLIKENRLSQTKYLLPDTTFHFLESPEAQKIISNIQTKE